MSEPFLAEIRIVGFDFAPRGWAFCDGQLLPINQNQSLYSLLGTIYGGDGRTSFALPDLRGRVPIHTGQDLTQGERGGEENHPLSVSEMAAHTHRAQASGQDANSPIPNNNLLATVPSRLYRTPTSLQPLSDSTVANSGAGQGHNNMMPFTTLTFCIALQGLFPPRN